MKILHVAPTYLPAVRYGGPIFAVHGLCRALAGRGHEVHVFTTNVDGPGTLSVPIDREVDVDGVRVHYFPSEFPRLYRSSGMRSALLETGSFDLVHVHAVYLWPGVAAATAARRAGVPYVISPRGMLVPDLIRRKNRFVKQAWLRFFERRGFAGAAAIHFTSRAEWDDASKIAIPLPSPMVVPNGVEIPERPDVARETAMLLHLGRISWKKRLDLVIDALPRLPGVRFVIAGNDEEALAPSLREQAVRLGVANRVDLVGPVYGDAKNALLARASLFVLMSDSENFGNAVLEALAMQTPVILSNGVGVAEDVVSAGAGVIGLDGVAGLLANTLLREEMGRRGRALVEERFGWSRVAGEMENVYRRILVRDPIADEPR